MLKYYLKTILIHKIIIFTTTIKYNPFTQLSKTYHKKLNIKSNKNNNFKNKILFFF